ncbi:polyphosphate polymerase domain-containing protein [Roseicyclus persicicus]|uniref:Polyphosphate polymerase domain-containing protein n=1 Tax=Roseicyclus persicicus TaxID=2650661 RepID=A0A7X6GV81_9RHOB|nr:polyphosphate polymerase domain-containing protein [Roseibacterium persicicum]NKX42976.1 polyphosphate polymerase domain-containing protein [Roseibacterium persicicum]
MLDEFATRFAPVTLDEMNAKAAMMTRLDNKYVLTVSDLMGAAAGLSEIFEVLDIDGQRLFTYETVYFDDDGRQSFFDHHQGRRRRCKVRTRAYVDAGLCFVEIKLKDKRGVTVKRRIPVDPDRRHHLCDAGRAHVAGSYSALYGAPFEAELHPVIQMRYRRMTLAARDGGERMTIDAGLSFWWGDRRRAVSDDLVIVETKSARGNGLADRVLRARHLHPVGGCSKYCVGMAALGEVPRYNRFLPAMRKLGLHEDLRAAA